jgi:hypothetical protein
MPRGARTLPPAGLRQGPWTRQLVAQLFDALNLSVNIAHSIPGGKQQPGAGGLDEQSTATDTLA